MEFEWDERKRLSNLEKHGLDFLRARSVFDGQCYTYSSPRKEDRWVTIGRALNQLVAVVWTRRGDVIRIISMRRLGMKKKGHIVSYTSEELEEMIARGEDRSDWARVDAMTEEELEAAIASDPDWADIPRDWYKHATPHFPKGAKQQVTLRLDPDVLCWFKEQGPGYQTRINAALRAFVEAHQRRR